MSTNEWPGAVVAARTRPNLLQRSDMRHRTLADRLWSRVVKHPGGCWEWTGGANERDGSYGRIHHGSDQPKKRYLVHRLAYELLVGPIPAGMTLDHLCRNSRCVNPDHLEPVTLAENSSRGIKKVLCSKGHAFTTENTYWYHGRRVCRTCSNRRWREYHARKQAKEPGAAQPYPERRRSAA